MHLDIPEKKREKLSVRCVETPEIINTADVVAGDYLLDAGELSIGYEGIALLPLQTREGVVSIQEKAFSKTEPFLGVSCFSSGVPPFAVFRKNDPIPLYPPAFGQPRLVLHLIFQHPAAR